MGRWPEEGCGIRVKAVFSTAALLTFRARRLLQELCCALEDSRRILGLCLPDARAPPPSSRQPNMPPDIAKCPLGIKLPLLRTTRLRVCAEEEWERGVIQMNLQTLGRGWPQWHSIQLFKTWAKAQWFTIATFYCLISPRAGHVTDTEDSIPFWGWKCWWGERRGVACLLLRLDF